MTGTKTTIPTTFKPRMPGKLSTQVVVRFTGMELDAVNAAAKSVNVRRAEFLRQAVLFAIDHMEAKPQP